MSVVSNSYQVNRPCMAVTSAPLRVRREPKCRFRTHWCALHEEETDPLSTADDAARREGPKLIGNQQKLMVPRGGVRLLVGFSYLARPTSVNRLIESQKIFSRLSHRTAFALRRPYSASYSRCCRDRSLAHSAWSLGGGHRSAFLAAGHTRSRSASACSTTKAASMATLVTRSRCSRRA